MRRNRTTNRERIGSTIQVLSHLDPGRMTELLYTAKCRGTDTKCLQDTNDHGNVVDVWTMVSHVCDPIHVQSRRLSAHCSFHAKILQGIDRDSHVWHPGRLLGVRVKAGQKSAEVDTYFVCGFSSTEVSSVEVREKYWHNTIWMLRSLTKRLRIIMAIDANVTMTGSKESYTWIERTDSVAKKESQVWNENDRALYRLWEIIPLRRWIRMEQHRSRRGHLSDTDAWTTSSRMFWTRRARRRGPTSQSQLPWTATGITVQWSPWFRRRQWLSKSRQSKDHPAGTAMPYWKRDGTNATRKYDGGVTLTKKKYLDERKGRITDPTEAHNYLEHHMDKNVMSHFRRTRERARKNQTSISINNLELMRKKQTMLKFLTISHDTKKFLMRYRLFTKAREMHRQNKNVFQYERRVTAEDLVEKTEIAAGKRRHTWALQLNAEDSPVETTPYSDEASLLSHNCCPWRTILNTRRGIGCQDPRIWIYLRGDSWRESDDQGRRPERTGHSDDRMLRGTLRYRRRCKDSEIPNELQDGSERCQKRGRAACEWIDNGDPKFLRVSDHDLLHKSLVRQLTDEDDWHSTED